MAMYLSNFRRKMKALVLDLAKGGGLICNVTKTMQFLQTLADQAARIVTRLPVGLGLVFSCHVAQVVLRPTQIGDQVGNTNDIIGAAVIEL